MSKYSETTQKAGKEVMQRLHKTLNINNDPLYDHVSELVATVASVHAVTPSDVCLATIEALDEFRDTIIALMLDFAKDGL